jgi:glycosyltransferase involved in cell wall biosynthesis
MRSAHRISVIIPAYNAEADIGAALDGLAASTLPDFEVILADDGSSDRTVSIAQAHALRPRVVRTVHGGAAHARNTGVAASQGEILVFLDADVVVHPDTMGRLIRALDDPTLDAIMGSYDDRPHHPQFLSQYRNLLHCFYHQTGRARASTFWTGCGAVRRAAFLAVDGFSVTSLVEDIDFGYRLCDAGRRLALDPTITVQHRKRWTLGAMIRTDIFARGVGWTHLILQTGRMPDDLNTGALQRLSVLLVAVMLLALPVGGWLVSLLALALILVLNRRLFQFLARKRGAWFATRAIPLFVLYLFYSGVSFGLGSLKFAWERATNRLRKSRTSTGLPM